MASLLSSALERISNKLLDRRFVDTVRAVSSELVHLSAPEFLAHSTQLREFASTRPADIIVPAFALANEALRRVFGFELYDVQLVAARALAAGAIAEMQTGEGKTFSALPAAIWGGLQGYGVHVSTTNLYLAQRDFEQLKPVYEIAGISVGVLLEKAESADKKAAYACDVTYGCGHEFGFDYLRDQMTLRSRATRQLGEILLQNLSGSGNQDSNETCQRGLAFAIVDEADNVMIDDATSPLVLSERAPGEASDSDAVRLARNIALTLEECHIHIAGPQQLELSDAGAELIHKNDVPIPVQQLLRPWATYVETALRAERLFDRDVHYVVDDGEVKIVDGSTGRIFADRTWQAGLHQAVEAKEGLPVTPESSSLAQITRQRFYRLYKRVSGMTGTAESCRRELKIVYGVRTQVIPLRTPSQRIMMPMRFFVSQDAKWNAIVASITQVHSSGRPVLIGTRTIAESEQLAARLRSQQLSFDMLNDRQDSEEAEIICRAGQSGRITVATNLAGRGTDIKLTDEVKSLGGLHVIVSECHRSPRIDRQMIGRSGRQGNPGSAQTFVSIDDWLVRSYGEWLTRSSLHLGNELGEITTNLEEPIRRIQSHAEREEYAVRAGMLRQDLSRDSLFD